MYDSNQATSLFNFLEEYKYQNLHTRKNRQENKVKVLNYLHGMKLISAERIAGYYCGSDRKKGRFEIKYEIKPTGTIEISSAIGLTKSEALNYVDKEKQKIIDRVFQDKDNIFVTYTKNHFYLRRNKHSKVTVAAVKAVKDEILSDSFVRKMANWGLNVVEGG